MCKSSFAKAWRYQAAKQSNRVPRIGGWLKSKGGEVGNVERTQAGTVTRAGFQRVSDNEFRRQWEALKVFFFFLFLF